MLFRPWKRVTIRAVPSSAAFLLLSLMVTPAQGQLFKRPDCKPPCPAPCPAVPTIPDKAAPVPPVPPPQPPQQLEPTITPEQFAGTEGSETFAAGAPNVIGDAGVIILPDGSTEIDSEGRTCAEIIADDDLEDDETCVDPVAASTQAAARVSAFKITENESPRPTSRLFFNYNYFNNVNATRAGVHREIPGFERTFLDGNASFGMRLPVFQTVGNDGDLNIRGFGNLNMIGKYAWINNRDTGNVLSSGMTCGVPTGRTIKIPNQSDIKSVVFQPFMGYLYNMMEGDLYVQGFSAVAVPTDIRDITIMFNSAALGYWLYRNPTADRLLTGVVPTLETHINTPLNHRGLDALPFGVQDSVVLTTGSHFVFNRSMFTLAVAAPVTGPKPFDIEAIALFNLRY